MGNPHGIFLAHITITLLTGIFVWQSSTTGDWCIRDIQAGFRPSAGCIDQVGILSSTLVYRHMFSRLRSFDLLNLEAAFESINRGISLNCLSISHVPHEFSSFIQSPYSNSRIWVHVYRNFWNRFIWICVLEACAFAFTFKLVIWMFMQIVLSSYEDSFFGICSGCQLSKSEYADDFVLLSRDAGES